MTATPPDIHEEAERLRARNRTLSAKIEKDAKTIQVLAARRDKNREIISVLKDRIEKMRTALNRAKAQVAPSAQSVVHVAQDIRSVPHEQPAPDPDAKELIRSLKVELSQAKKAHALAAKSSRLLKDQIRLDMGFSDLAERVKSVSETEQFSRLDYLKWIDTLMGRRKLDQLEQAIPAFGDIETVLADYARASLGYYRGSDDVSFRTLLAHIQDGLRPLEARRVLNMTLLLSFRGTREDILEVAGAVAPEHFAELGRPMQVGLLRELVRHDETDLAKDFARHLVGMSDLRRLYYVGLHVETPGVLDGLFPEVDGADTGALFDMVERLTRTTLTQLHEPITGDILNILRAVPPSCDLSNARGNSLQLHDLENVIEQSLMQRRGLSLIRLGDGESYAFQVGHLDDGLHQIAKADRDMRERLWWGTHPTAKQSDAIRKSVRSAVEQATILGLPGIYRIIRDLPGRDLGMESLSSLRGISHVIKATADKTTRGGCLVAEERVHYVLHKSGAFARLAETADRLVMVGSWPTEHYRGTFAEGATVIQVSPHQKVRDINPDARPLFETWQDVDAEVARHTRPGTLVLVGAGLIGKIFCETARAKGAVVLDVGAVLDYLGGRRTRGSADI